MQIEREEIERLARTVMTSWPFLSATSTRVQDTSVGKNAVSGPRGFKKGPVTRKRWTISRGPVVADWR